LVADSARTVKRLRMSGSGLAAQSRIWIVTNPL
jgi:hypothetical protein